MTNQATIDEFCSMYSESTVKAEAFARDYLVKQDISDPSKRGTIWNSMQGLAFKSKDSEIAFKNIYRNCIKQHFKNGGDAQNDIIHIKEYEPVGQYMSRKTQRALTKAAHALDPSHQRAQLLKIASYKMEFIAEKDRFESIAERFTRDHATLENAMRHAYNLVVLGRANSFDVRPHMFGVITFEDGSTF